MLSSILNLKRGEKVIHQVRPSWWTEFWQIILSTVLVLLPFFLIYPLFQRGKWGVIIFSVLIAIAVWLVMRLIVSHHQTVFIMTNKRIIDIDQVGFFDREVTETLYNRIKSVHYKRKGLNQMILRLGDIYIEFIGDDSQMMKLKIEAVRNPEWVASEILLLQENYLTKRANSRSYKSKRILKKIKSRLGKKQYERLISD